MSINYKKVNDGKGWARGVPFNPTNATTMEQGIKSACDGVDAINALDLDGRLTRNGYGELSGSRNIFDGNVVKGEYWDDSNGNTGVGSNWQRTATLVKAKPSTTYYVIADGSISGSFGTACCYNANKEYLGYASPTVIKAGEYRFDSLPNTSYVTMYWAMAWGDTKVCLSESNVYEPYFESNKMLTEDTAEIASLKYLGWTVPRGYSGPRNYVDADGKFHQRVGRVDLGDLRWSITSDGSSRFYCYDQVPIKSYTTNETPNIFCSKYQTHSFTGISNGQITAYLSGGHTYISAVNTSFNDPTAFRSAMQGVYLYYELATEVVISEGNEMGVKAYVGTITTAQLNGNADKQISVTLPSQYQEIISVIPIGSDVLSTWNTRLHFIRSSKDGVITARTVGTDTQAYTVNYVVLYK